MGAKIIGFVVLLLLIVGGYMAYEHYKEAKVAENGGYHCNGCLSPEKEAQYQREDHGETADGQSDHKNETARQAAADDARSADPAVFTPQPRQSGVQSPTDQGNPGFAHPAAGMPVTDSQAANAPNGMRFAGSGSYQWYRQGSLTWRVNTNSGQSCIIYATMEEWRKDIVLSHGCGRDS